ncbi:MAG: Holliday junction branch migration protein RuvA [Oscillospiraceae bacterium]|nr:Holliday junction branch migration protein RuvA [Oscillospiraceae bacterium]
MFYSISGKIVFSDTSSVALECGGVAFKCSVTLNTFKNLGNIGEEARLYTYLSVSENSLELFGFYDEQELEFFKLLLGVSGVGPKAAVAILSQNTPSALALSIAAGDIKAITRAQGVGPKIAQRVVLELKDKMSKLAPQRLSSEETFSAQQVSMGGNISEAVSALVSLGFSAADAAKALSNADASLRVEDLVKIGLKQLY